MLYEIIGGNLPAVICKLKRGEKVVCESGGMSWMQDVFTMETVGGGLGKMFSRMLSGESAFKNVYTAREDGEIAFASSFPGDILAVEVGPGKSIIAQKKAFLAGEAGVDFAVHFQKKFGGGFFGGEGFIMQKLSGRGLAFIEIDGSSVEYDLLPGQQMIIDTGNLAMADVTVDIDIQTVKGVKNVLFGGEGLFNTVVTGPGKITLQTMPLSGFANTIASVLPKGD